MFFFKTEAIVFIIYPSNIFGNVQALLEDFKMGEYHSTGEYFTVVAGAISDICN